MAATRISIYTIGLLALLGAISSVSNYVIIPLTPKLSSVFGVPVATIQMVLTVYLAAGALGELVWGPLSDRLGRRPMLLIGLLLFIIGTTICALAPNSTVLILGRALQAFGGVSGLVLARVIASDLLDLNRTASVIAYITLFRFLGPMVAPALGTMIEAKLGWRAVFYVLLATGLVLTIIVLVKLSETRPASKTRKLTGQMAEYKALVTSRTFWGFVINICGITGMAYAFLGEAPFLFVKTLGRTAQEFGLYFFIIAGGYLLGNLISGRLVLSLGTRPLIRAAIGIAVFGIILFWLAIGIKHPMAIIGPMAVIGLGNGIMLPCAKAHAIRIREQLSGTASGLFGAIQVGFAAIVTLLMGLSHNGSPYPMVIGITLCGLLAFGGYFVAQRTAKS